MNHIQEYLEKHELKYHALIGAIGVSQTHAHDLARSKKPVTPAVAVKFARWIGKPQKWRDYVSEPEGV